MRVHPRISLRSSGLRLLPKSNVGNILRRELRERG
jgi:hypothetical protein